MPIDDLLDQASRLRRHSLALTEWSAAHCAGLTAEGLAELNGLLQRLDETSGRLEGDALKLADRVRQPAGKARERGRTEELRLVKRDLDDSRARWQLAADAAHIGRWQWKIEGDQILLDAIAGDLLGFGGEAKITYQDFLDRLHPDDRARVDAVIQHVISEQTPYDNQYRVVTPDGGTRWIHVRGGLQLEEGKPAGMLGIVQDETGEWQARQERQRLGEEIRRQNETLEQIIKNVPVAVAVLSGPEFRYSLTNPQFMEFARGQGDVIGRTSEEVWQEQYPLFQAAFERVFHQGETLSGVDLPYPLERDGQTFQAYVTYNLSPLHGPDGQVTGILLLLEETTEQVINRRRIESEQSRFRAVVETAPEAILVVDHHAHLVFANRAAERLHGKLLPVGWDVRNAVKNLRHLDGSMLDLDELPLVRASMRGDSVTNLELRFVRDDGGQRVLMVNAAPFGESGEPPSGAVAILHDITERRIEDEEMVKRAAQIELQHYLIQGREMERLQISQELHEGFLQDLIGAKYRIQQALDVDEKEERLKRLYTVLASLSDVTQNLRDYCYELRPPALVPFGVERALRSFSDGYMRKYPGLKIDLDLMPDRQQLHQDVRVALFRIYQEVMNNVARHAGATNIKVRFSITATEAELTISDNGHGFEIPDNWLEIARQGHLGLAAAQERAEAVGGILNIQSASGAGTTVSVRVPVRPFAR